MKHLLMVTIPSYVCVDVDELGASKVVVIETLVDQADCAIWRSDSDPLAIVVNGDGDVILTISKNLTDDEIWEVLALCKKACEKSV